MRDPGGTNRAATPARLRLGIPVFEELGLREGLPTGNSPPLPRSRPLVTTLPPNPIQKLQRIPTPDPLTLL